MATKTWKAVLDEAGVSAERRASSARRAREIIATMKLPELRKARSLTQHQLAAQLGCSQSSVSELEGRADMLLSTLRRFLRAAGGELEIRVRFPEGDILIEDFATVGEIAEESVER